MLNSRLQLWVDRFSDRKGGHLDRPATQILSRNTTRGISMKHQKLCECGCGNPVSLASKTNSKRGWKKGYPIRFIVGHASRKQYNTITFWVNKKSGCWIWQGSKISTGYGNLRVNGKTILAHRYMYELIKGEIPRELELDHLCRNPICINPAHLEAVTHAENCQRGKRAKLNRRTVELAKYMRKQGHTITYIANFLQVERHTVSSAIKGKAWA